MHKNILLSVLMFFISIFISNCKQVSLIDLTGKTIEKVENKSVIAVWPTGTEGINPNVPEKAKPCNKRFYNIHNPNLTVFKPDKPNGGTAIVLCPGGGFSYVASGVEGDPVAQILNQHGITVFVLKYRLPNTPGAKFEHPVPLSDAQRAIQLVRYHAQSLEINPEKIGIMGFSAGGFLASSVGAKVVNLHATPDAIDKTNCQPNFRVLIYTGMADEVKQNLKNYSPTLLIHAKDDDVVKPERSIAIYEALKAISIPVELKLYESGSHGFGAGRPGTDSVNWINDCIQWLQRMNFLCES